MDAVVCKEYLDITMQVMAGNPKPEKFVYRGMYDFIRQHGQAFAPSASQMLPGPFPVWPQQCFDNAYRLAQKWKTRFRYVEGIALGVIPTYHAWCINAADEVIDPTWDRYTNHQVGSEYFGVVIPLPIAKEVRNRQSTAIIDNWTRGWPLLREPWSARLERL